MIYADDDDDTSSPTCDVIFTAMIPLSDVQETRTSIRQMFQVVKYDDSMTTVRCLPQREFCELTLHGKMLANDEHAMRLLYDTDGTYIGGDQIIRGWKHEVRHDGLPL